MNIFSLCVVRYPLELTRIETKDFRYFFHNFWLSSFGDSCGGWLILAYIFFYIFQTKHFQIKKNLTSSSAELAFMLTQFWCWVFSQEDDSGIS